MKAPIDQPVNLPNARRATMSAIVQDQYGSVPAHVLRLDEIDRPEIGDDDVLVRVVAASVDKGTWHLTTGRPYAMRLAGFGVRAPKAPNPGRAFAGTVEAVGPNVTGFASGASVFGTCDGSFAAYARVRPDMLAAMPANLSFAQAASAPISGVTALQAVRKAGIEAGHRVLIVGASGGVGSFAVQIAKAFGAEVTGVCSAAKTDFVRALGADHVIDYTGDDFADGEREYDVILDAGSSRRISHLRRALTPRGTLVIIGTDTGGRWLGGFQRGLGAVLLSPMVGQRLGMLVSSENAADLEALGELIESGQVEPAVDRTYPLGDVASAVTYLHEGHARGKIVITI